MSAAGVEELREQQRAMSDVLRAVARSEGLQPVLDEIVEAATRLCRADAAFIHLAEGGLFLVQAAFGVSAEAIAYEREHPDPAGPGSLTGRVALTGEPVHIPDVLADPGYTYPMPDFGPRTLLGVPVLIEDELVGVIGLSRNEVHPFERGEIDLVATFADQAAIALANARLIEAVERQRTELSRFLSPQVAELISSPQGEELLAGHRAYITCLFCDLRGFTAFAETAAPEELFEVLRAYHQTLGELIRSYDGTLEHFAGDGVMVFFNDPVPVEEHELQAIRLALAAQERVGELAETWGRRGIELALGIGMEAGYATLGRIGFEGRYDYGALGPVTNLASRLSTRAEAGQILIGQRAFAAVEARVDAVPVGALELKGFGRPINAYEVRGLEATERVGRR
jgi:class 3 adenylate cyclase